MIDEFLANQRVSVLRHWSINGFAPELFSLITLKAGSDFILACRSAHSAQSAHGKYLIRELIPRVYCACVDGITVGCRLLRIRYVTAW